MSIRFPPLQTIAEISQLQPKEKGYVWRRILNPLGTIGLYIRVTPHNARAYYYRYGDSKKYLIARFNEMALQQVFTEHQRLALLVREGHDVCADRDREEAKAIATSNNPKTFNGILDIYLEKHVSKLAASTQDTTTVRINKWIRPALGNLHPDDLEPHHFKTLRDEITKTGKLPTSNAVLGLCKSVCSFAVSELYIPVNPATGIKYDHKPVNRQRVWSNEELRLIWQALSEPRPNLPPSHQLCAKIILLTGSRRTEIAYLTRDEITFDDLHGDCLISLSKARTKTSIEHKIYCNPRVTKLVRQAVELSDHPTRVFVNFDTKHAVEQKTITKYFNRMLKEIGVEDSTLHDSRHLWETRVIESGKVDIIAADLCMSHVGMTGAGRQYTHSVPFSKMKVCWDWYDQWLHGVVDGKRNQESNVGATVLEMFRQ